MKVLFSSMQTQDIKNKWPFSVCEKNWLLLCWASGSNNFYVDFHTKCENPHIAIVQFSRLGRQFP